MIELLILSSALLLSSVLSIVFRPSMRCNFEQVGCYFMGLFLFCVVVASRQQTAGPLLLAIIGLAILPIVFFLMMSSASSEE